MENISTTAKNRRGLQFTFALTFAYFIGEVMGGILTNTLALLADAAHMLADVFGLDLSLFATWISQKPATPACIVAPIEEATNMQLSSTLKCPNCDYTEQVIMPLDYCQFFYECKACHEIMKAKQGHCCVFCSYGDVPCPSVQKPN